MLHASEPSVPHLSLTTEHTETTEKNSPLELRELCDLCG
jgi:hypothetical protein